MTRHIFSMLLFAFVGNAAAEESVPSKRAQKHFAKAGGCDRSDMETSFLDDFKDAAGYKHSSWLVQGCGDDFIATWITPLGPFVIGLVTDIALRKRASFDMGCPAEDIEYTFIDYETRGVSGCDKRFTYVYIDRGWLLNMNATEQPSP